MKLKDQRIKLMNEILNGIKVRIPELPTFLFCVFVLFCILL